MKNNIKRTIAVIVAAMVLMSIGCADAFAKAGEENSVELFAATATKPETYINFDFERYGTATDFANERYRRSTKTIETDTETGNKFLRFTYDAENTEAPLYSEDICPTSGAASTLNITGNIVMSFDIRFWNNDGTIYLKERKPSVNNIVLRVGTRSDGRLVYGTSDGVSFFLDNNRNYFYIQDKWYNIQIVANITADEAYAKQSIYITDKFTGELEAKVENVPLNIAVASCNLVMVGTSHQVDLDNLIIEQSDTQDMRIVGSPYPVCGRKSSYTVRSISKSGVALFNNNVVPAWSLLYAVKGVTIDPTTGVLTVASNASLSPVIIKADAVINDVSKTRYYLVEIEK